MQHYCDNIGEDWFTYKELYKYVVSYFSHGKFVEVGSWKGRSSVFLGVEILNSGKDITLDCVDIWQNLPSLEYYQQSSGDSIYLEFIKNIQPINQVKEIIKPIRKDSVEASKLYQNNSIDFIFIDGDHSFEGINRDLHAWFPKLSKSGIIAGHDYTWNKDIRSAVDIFFNREEEKNVEETEGCFLYRRSC